MFSLIFGIAFLGMVVTWLVHLWVTVDLPAVGWLLASALILLGVAGLAGTLRRERSERPGS